MDFTPNEHPVLEGRLVFVVGTVSLDLGKATLPVDLSGLVPAPAGPDTRITYPISKGEQLNRLIAENLGVGNLTDPGQVDQGKVQFPPAEPWTPDPWHDTRPGMNAHHVEGRVVFHGLQVFKEEQARFLMPSKAIDPHPGHEHVWSRAVLPSEEARGLNVDAEYGCQQVGCYAVIQVRNKP